MAAVGVDIKTTKEWVAHVHQASQEGMATLNMLSAMSS
jgi:hypothetical protein